MSIHLEPAPRTIEIYEFMNQGSFNPYRAICPKTLFPNCMSVSWLFEKYKGLTEGLALSIVYYLKALKDNERIPQMLVPMVFTTKYHTLKVNTGCLIVPLFFSVPRNFRYRELTTLNSKFWHCVLIKSNTYEPYLTSLQKIQKNPETI